jgi:predicted amidohydrolase YtcJ
MKLSSILLAIVFICEAAQAQSPDLVLMNGNIITLKSKGDRAQAVAIKGDKIVAVGTNDEIRKLASSSTRVIDLNGKTVMPGFNDVHQHPAPLYSWDKPFATLRLDTVSSMNSLINLLKRKAAITPKGMLISGRGYNEMKLGGQPIRDILDKASTDHPILITHASGHLCAVNSIILQANGIDEHTPDPPGGSLERYKGNVPDGIIKESAQGLLSSKKVTRAPSPTKEEELEGYRLYFHDLIASGLTSIGDCWVTPEKVKMYQQLVAENFPLRFNLYIGVNYLDQLIDGRIPRIESDYLRINGVKMFHGNSLSGKTCWLYEPYDTINPATGKQDYYGIPPARSQASLDSLVLKIHSAGLQIACHSNGDREIDMVISAIEKAQQVNPRPNARHRIEHCSITNQRILERIKKDEIIPVFHCYINELGRQLMVYGGDRLKMIMPTKSAQDMNIIYALHSDFPVSRYESMIRLGSAVNRTTSDGIVLGENQKISAEDAIKAYAVGGAYTSFEENKKGRIVPGQFADMIIVDRDPTTINTNEIPSIQVLTTIVGGKIAFSKN